MLATSRRAMASPKPAPPPARVAIGSPCSNSSKIFARAAGAIPGPVSSTTKRSEPSPAGATLTPTPPFCVKFTALPARLIST